MVRISATVFYSYQICPRQAWLYHHCIDSEEENPYLSVGRLVHEHSYSRDRKEIFIDGFLKIDILRDELVAEIKKSSRHRDAARLQLLYYLYYLRLEKGLELKGILLFPKERKKERVLLTEEDKRKIEDLLEEMRPVLESDIPPAVVRSRYCQACAFREFCWA